MAFTVEKLEDLREKIAASQIRIDRAERQLKIEKAKLTAMKEEESVIASSADLQTAEPTKKPAKRPTTKRRGNWCSQLTMIFCQRS